MPLAAGLPLDRPHFVIIVHIYHEIWHKNAYMCNGSGFGGLKHDYSLIFVVWENF